MNGFHPRQGWAELARYAEACVDLDLTPMQEIQRLSMLLAMVEEMTAGLNQEADALAERPRNLGTELLEGVREIKAGGGKRYPSMEPNE